MTSVAEFTLHVERREGYELAVHFDKPTFPDLVLDEPPPLGKDVGPNPARILSAAIGSCLAASLIFCLGRAKIGVGKVTADVQVELIRNERKRLRVGKVRVTLHPSIEGDADVTTCLASFEDFCVVTQSVREGIDVEVSVEPVRA